MHFQGKHSSLQDCWCYPWLLSSQGRMLLPQLLALCPSSTPCICNIFLWPGRQTVLAGGINQGRGWWWWEHLWGEARTWMPCLFTASVGQCHLHGPQWHPDPFSLHVTTLLVPEAQISPCSCISTLEIPNSHVKSTLPKAPFRRGSLCHVPSWQICAVTDWELALMRFEVARGVISQRKLSQLTYFQYHLPGYYNYTPLN